MATMYFWAKTTEEGNLQAPAPVWAGPKEGKTEIGYYLMNEIIKWIKTGKWKSNEKQGKSSKINSG